MNGVNRLLVIEDEPKDLMLAAETARSMGIAEVVARTSLEAARKYLDEGLEGAGPLPDGIILDLSLGYESGYELLRFWHSNPKLSKIPLMVWSVRADNQREMCKLFNVTSFVSKWEGDEALREALRKLERPAA
jgi:CheY-like chemotaxis protein